MTQSTQVFRASILHFTDVPRVDSYSALGLSGVEYFPDGILLVQDGRVIACGHADELINQGVDPASCVDYTGKLIMSGFIDSHAHAPQTQVIASYGEQLLDWLNQYTFPCEAQFSDKAFARQSADIFLDQLMSHGTTTAMVYTTVFADSTDAFFEAAAARNLRMIAGKVMMDRHAPDNLLDTAETGERESRALIERWHKQQRLAYAVTPRFAPTSSPAQLAAAGRLLQAAPDAYMQTHLSENLGEIAWVKQLFPGARDYLDVYDQFGLLSERSVFGHGIHLSDRELTRLAETGSGIAFCPTSNLFLGSGLLDVARVEAANVNLSIATDVGGGTSFSLLRTLSEAYKILQLQGQKLPALKGLYMATLGNARALKLDSHIGNFAKGREADFNVIDLAATPLQALRQGTSKSLSESLFALMILGDEKNILQTYIKGERWSGRDAMLKGAI